MLAEEFTERDIANLAELQPPDWGDIRPHFEYHIKSSRAHPIKFEIDGKLVAVGTTILHANTAWLAQIIVHSGYRNRSLGTKMTQALLGLINSETHPTVYLIATALGEPVYRKLGFAEEGGQVFMKGVKGQDRVAIPEIVSYHSQYADRLFAMDADVSGEDRSQRLLEHLDDAMVYVSNGELLGYYLPGLGEGHIIATNPEAGKALMAYRLQYYDSAVLPLENAIGIQLLEERGFSRTRVAKRMRLGPERSWKPGCMYNRISGQLG